MNDLSGLDWNSKPSSVPAAQQAPTRSTPSPGFSRQTTPNSASGQTAAAKAAPGAAPASSKASNVNSFSNLLAPQPARPVASTLSLEERQRQLNAQKSRPRGSEDPFAASDAQFWEGLGSGRGTPAPSEVPKLSTKDDNDLLAAFSAAAPVDRSSHFPPPSRSNLQSPPAPVSRGRSPASDTGTNGVRRHPNTTFDDDDDPFGLGEMAQKPAMSAFRPVQDDDDILGDLGKPVEETLAARRREEDARKAEVAQRAPRGASKEDKALAELLDMGFDIDKARRALAQTESGNDTQGAIGVLLNEAHGETGSRNRSAARPSTASRTTRGKPHAENRTDGQSPAWMDKGQGAERSTARSPGGEEKEISQVASEIGTSVWKSANTFWKAGQKRMAKAVADFQQESESDQPKWMRDAQLQEQAARPLPPGRPGTQPQRGPAEEHNDGKITAEAAWLDVDAKAPRTASNGSAQETSAHSRQPHPTSSHTRVSEGSRPSRSSPLPEMPAAQRPTSRPAERLSRRYVEEESAQAYVSPARRKKVEPKSQVAPEPAPAPALAETLDIFSEVQAPPAAKPAVTSTAKQGRTTGAPTPAKPRPAAPARKTPETSAAVLNTSKSHRQAGGAFFKQGDYAAANSSYTKALAGLPRSHPILIVLHSNRALTYLKTGDAKGALTDAEAALALIGPSAGDGESIDLGEEGNKPMRDFFGKALMRKAEAYEHLEKWDDASQVWRDAVQAGVGGAIAIQGRNRCEKAASPAPAKVAPMRKKAPAPAKVTPRTSALAELNGKAEGEAVKRLREQNAAAAAASDEQFALTDAVDAKLATWKSGKSENLRALLASLDTVLWAEAGWNKVGMGDLVLPNRVKIVYMKAIAKVHPDKLSQTATTEQKMISASVFATLNEAWDKFKKDNGM